MYGMSNIINSRIGGAFVFLAIFKCLPFFIYQHIEMLVSQVKEWHVADSYVVICDHQVIFCDSIVVGKHFAGRQ
jgi:hypothetical protein